MGYKTEVGVVVDGDCVSHEMDVIGTNNNEQHLAECKYSKDQGKQVSIQVPLYVRARVDDIVRKRQKMPVYQDFAFTGWVITNTRFSSDSIQYPLTVLRNLTMKAKQNLLNEGFVTCNQLLDHSDILTKLELRKSKYSDLINELNDICA